MQNDGNLVLYKDKNPLWASDTWGKKGARAVVQDDGNFVLYDTNNNPVWASGTNGKGTGPYSLTLGDDARLVLNDSTHTAIWSSVKPKSDTIFSSPTGLQYNQLLNGESIYSKNGDFNLILQNDGNLVLYK
ncbi:MAG: bulb-type lectin domain-containing protein, partial [Flammeovirgaceae bacterium]